MEENFIHILITGGLIILVLTIIAVLSNRKKKGEAPISGKNINSLITNAVAKNDFAKAWRIAQESNQLHHLALTLELHGAKRESAKAYRKLEDHEKSDTLYFELLANARSDKKWHDAFEIAREANFMDKDGNCRVRNISEQNTISLAEIAEHNGYFDSAVELYLSGGQGFRGVDLASKKGDIQKALTICMESDNWNLFLEGAVMAARNGMGDLAVDMFVEAEDYDKALQVAKKLKLEERIQELEVLIAKQNH